jgi:cell division protease FtsH
MGVDDLLRAIAGEDDGRSEAILRRIAIHEAGHAFVCARDHGADRVTVTIRAQADAAGRTIVSKLPKDDRHTKNDMIARITMLLAGRAAEEIILGEAGRGAGGSADSDLGQATTIATAMAGKFGLIGPTPLLYRGGASAGLDILDLNPSMEKATYEFLFQVYTVTLALIRSNRDTVEAIAAALLMQKTLSGAALAQIIAAVPQEDGARLPL